METINTYYEDLAGLQTFVEHNSKVLFSPDNSATLVQIFSGVYEENTIMTICGQIARLVPNAKIIGATTGGEIMNGLVSGLKTVLSFSVFNNSDIKVAYVEKNNVDDYDLGRSLATVLNSDKARVLILYATGLTLNAGRLLKGIESVNPGLTVAGGSAGSNFSNAQSFVFNAQTITDHGAIGAVIESDDLTATCHSHLGWQPIGKEMTITRAEGSRVYTIDHMPAYQVYQQYLGIDDNSDILKVDEFPLIINKQGLEIARVPFFRYDDDSLGFFGDISEGEKVHFSFGHVNMILEKMKTLLQSIKQESVDSILVYSCSARRGFLRKSAQIETLPLQEIAPTAGFFTNGEFFHSHNANELLNTTMTTLVLSELPSCKKTLKTGTGIAANPKPTENQVALPTDNITDRNIEILKALTHLVDMVTSELNVKTAELESANKQLQYNSQHDTLTGLYNRGFFEQEIERLEGQASIIMCDIDGLKFINDSFGHNAGDHILKVTADILRASFGPGDVVARIGGDEFSVLMPGAARIEAEDACLRINNAAAAYNRNQSVLPLRISKGIACRENELIAIDSLIKEADCKMYREKLHHSQSPQSDFMQTLMKVIEEKDIITKEYSDKLQGLFISLALDSGIPPGKLNEACQLARFHDIGKIGISDNILFKSEPFSAAEEEEMQRHCEIGYRIARSSRELLPIAESILKHHEWWNGQGYPLGLKEDDIPLECRILSIIDAYDAMTNDRPYRKAMSSDEALEEIKRCAGSRFDPVLVNKFINIIKKG